MRSSSLMFIGFSLALSVGCDTSPEAIEPPEPPATSEPIPLDVVPTDDVVLPTSLTCVSEPLDGTNDVLRAQISSGADLSSVTLQRGPQFWSHGSVWATPRETEVRSVTASGGLLVEGDDRGLTIALAPDGPVLRGTLVDDQCTERVETSLTCWSALELWGSPWTGVEGSLPAHFDWSTSECVDVDGHPALNRVPVEVVRETGNGECADLRGVALNGADYTHPDLSGWNLMGARLDGATLFFASLDNATLNGAKLSDLQFGYATITGFVDDETELPNGCETQSSPWSGATASCSQ